jgi:transcriptional regulator with XRE-family HTH domain
MKVDMTKKEYYIWIRQKKGISQKEIADNLGITKVAIHYYESGKTNFRYNREEEYRKYIDRHK